MSVTIVPDDIATHGLVDGGELTRTGIGMIPTYRFQNNGRVVLMLKNTGGEIGPVVVRSQHHVTQKSDIQHLTLSVPATTGDVIAGPFPVWPYNDADGYVTFSPNLVDNGDCESETVPALWDGSTPASSNCTFARSDAQADEGTYSYLLTKTIAAGTGGNQYLHPAGDPRRTTLRGIIPGGSYTFRARIYIPSGGIQGSEVVLNIGNYTGSWDVTSQAAAASYDAWQTVEVTKTIAAAATGILFRIDAASAAALNEFFYVDQIGVHPASTESADMTAALIRRAN